MRFDGKHTSDSGLQKPFLYWTAGVEKSIMLLACHRSRSLHYSARRAKLRRERKNRAAPVGMTKLVEVPEETDT